MTDTQPADYHFESIRQIEDLNRSVGQHFFDTDTLNFFNSKVFPHIYGGRFFVTRESYDGVEWGSEKFTVRVAHADGSIGNVGKIQQYELYGQAVAVARLAALEVVE